MTMLVAVDVIRFGASSQDGSADCGRGWRDATNGDANVKIRLRAEE
jgi:hypothetical protein